MKNKFLNSVLSILGFVLFCVVFASCENFLKGQETRDEIKRVIAYSNADSYTIRVEAAKGSGTILIPAGLEVTKKVTDTFTVKFEPDDAFKFVQWTATVPDLAEGDSASNYIKFEDATSLETTVTFTKAHPGIVITPDCPAIPTATITLEGGHGTFSPTTGQHAIRQWVPLSISYDPLDEYAFVRWKISDLNTKKEIENGRYITITDPKSKKTECELTTPLPENSNINLCIEAVCDKRPRIVSAIPQWTDDGVRKDSRIQIMFDKPMSPKSIYYDEVAGELEKLGQVDSYLRDSQSRCYGYVKNDKHYFKNIQIQDYSSNDKSIADRFKAPYFETSKTLVIPVNDTNLPDTGTTIIVSLSEEFFLEREDESQNDLPVTIKESYIWQYLVNKDTDREPPAFLDSSIVIQNTNGDSFVGGTATSPKKLLNRTLKMKLYAQDTIQNPTSNFVLYIQNEAGTYIKSVNVPASVYMKKASFEDDTNPNNPVPKAFEIPDEIALPDGKYRFLFSCADKSGNLATYPENASVTIEDLTDLSALNTLWFQMDNKGPEIQSVSFIYDNAPLTVSMKIDSDEYEDLDQLKIICSEVNSSTTITKEVKKNQLSPASLSPTGEYTYTVPGADYGKTYNLNIQTYDDINNLKEYTYSNCNTKPNAPSNVKVKIIRNNGGFGTILPENDKVEFTWIKPTGNYTGIVIKYKSKTYYASDWSSLNICDSYKDTSSDTTSSLVARFGLGESTEYQFKVYSYFQDETFLSNASYAAVDNGITITQEGQTTEVAGSTATTIASKPNGIFSGNLSTERANNKITIKNLMGTSSRTGTLISYLKSGTTTWSSPVSSTEDEVEISGLEAATNYKIKVESYYKKTGNVGVPCVIEEYTSISAPSAPTVTLSNSTRLENGKQTPCVAANISWASLTGGFSGYYVDINKVKEDSTEEEVWNHHDAGNNLSVVCNELDYLSTYKIRVGVYLNVGSQVVYLTPSQFTEKETSYEPCSIKAIGRSGRQLRVGWELPKGHASNFPHINLVTTNYLGYGSTEEEAAQNAVENSGKSIALTISKNSNNKYEPDPAFIDIETLGEDMMGKTCYFVIKSEFTMATTTVDSIASSFLIPEIILPVKFNPVPDWDKSDKSVRFTWDNPTKWDKLELYKQSFDLAPNQRPIEIIRPSNPNPESYTVSIGEDDTATSLSLYISTYYRNESSELVHLTVALDTSYDDLNEDLSYSNNKLNLSWDEPEDSTYYYRIRYVDVTAAEHVWYFVTKKGGSHSQSTYEVTNVPKCLSASDVNTYMHTCSVSVAPYAALIPDHIYSLKLERCQMGLDMFNPVIQTVNTIMFSYDGSDIDIIDF